MAWLDRSGMQPHQLLYQAVCANLPNNDTAQELAQWAEAIFGMTAIHPAGKDESGNSRKNLWPPPEGTAPAPPEDKNLLIKLLTDVSSNQDSLLEDHILLSS